MSDFIEYSFKVQSIRSLFKSEMEDFINQAAQKNQLVLPDPFGRNQYEFYCQTYPDVPYTDIKIVFLARPKTADEILAEQIEFQIKQLES